MTISGLFRRDIGRRIANDGVAKVWNEALLIQELEDYVITEEIAADLAGLLETFFDSVDSRRRGSPREGMAAWISGFFGSGKSHFAKISGHMLANTQVEADSARSTIDLLEPHVEHTSKSDDLKGYFHRLRNQVYVHPVMIEMKSRDNLIGEGSVAEICMKGFYHSIGLSTTLYIARIELLLIDHGVYDSFRQFYSDEFGEPWETGRQHEIFNRGRIAKALVHVLPGEFSDIAAAEKALEDAKAAEAVDAESFADIFIRHLHRMDAQDDHREPHIVFVLDEMQQFAADDPQRIEELRTLVESLGARAHGRVWVICCGQEALDKVVGRAGLELGGLGKLDARFSHRVHLRSENVTEVIADLILRKRETVLPQLADLYGAKNGFLAECCDLDLDRRISQTQLDEDAFVAYYPFLPYQMVLAQRIFDTMRGTKLSGNERSMLAVTQPILRKLAEANVGAIVPFDWVFDQIENELCSDDHLGTHGVNSIKQSDREVPDWEVEPSRCLKVLWLIQRLNWIARTAENIARLLVNDINSDMAEHRKKVEATLQKLQHAGYVALDEGSNQFKFLSAEEGEVEKALLDKQSDLSLGDVVRRSRTIIKESVLTRRKLNEFRVSYGKSSALIDFSLIIDSEEVTSGGEITVEAFGPLSSADMKQIERQCIAAGPRGSTIWWIARGNGNLQERLERLVALEWLVSDPKHKASRSAKYIEAVEDKRQEADELRQAVADDLEKCFARGAVCYAGETEELDGKPIGTAIQRIVSDLIPSIYTLFGPADVAYDPDAAEQLMDPANRNLQDASGGPDLFDSSGALLRSAPLVEPVLEELKSRADGHQPTDGKAIADHFAATPFGWPEDLVRVVLAATVRGGAVSVAISGQQHFDFSESVVRKALSSVREFRRTQFAFIEGGLNLEEIIRAKELLIALGVSGVPEAANAQARAIRELAKRFVADAGNAASMAGMGLPLPETYKLVETCCSPLISENDPSKVVRSFLADSETWSQINQFLHDIEEFRQQNRNRLYTQFQELIGRCENNRTLQRSEQGPVAEEALAELQAMKEARTVVSKWPTYQDNARRLEEAFRKTYREQLNQAAQGADDLRLHIERMPEWEKLDKDARQTIMSKHFGSGGELYIFDPGDLSDLETLLSQSKRLSLQALETMVTGLAAYERNIAADVREAFEEQQRRDGEDVQKSFVWRSAEDLRGKRIEDSNQLDETLNAVRAKLAKQLEAGNIIIVE